KDLLQLVMSGSADPLEGDIQDRLGPLKLSPVLDPVVHQRSILRASTQRDQEDTLGTHLTRTRRAIHVRTHGGVVGEHAAIYQSFIVSWVGTWQLERLEVRRRRRGRPRYHPQ